ncbi:MAG: hypothetical protein EPN85_07300 [Bacteroidetes bacterium]|nr:MAG: hypothetical protein EPN85_07300 [Bacteroidota bacterium]
MDEIYKYIYKRDKPFMVKLLAAMVAGVALLKIQNTPIFGLIMGLGSVGLFGYQSGIEVDFKNKKYRLITTFGPQVFGNWQPLPPLKYISVFKANLVSTVTGFTGTTVTQKKEVTQVNLITDKNKLLRLLETKDMNEAFEFAKQTAPKLDLKIWNATVRPAEWLR